MNQAIVLREHGAAEVLQAERSQIPRPAPGEILIRQTAIGVNFHDVYVRNGSYRTLSLPGIPGIEAVGVVEQAGADVQGLRVGDRVGYVTGAYGAYAHWRTLYAEMAIPVPDSVDDVKAASLLLKGLTAEMLLNRVQAIRSGMQILVHAAGGGVGRLLCQWASHLGARVIGTAGNESKAAAAREAGCHHTILYRETDFVSEVKRLTDDVGVDVVYDAVGKDTFDGSLSVLAPMGHLVNFGQASGPVPPFEVGRLAARSATLTRPIIFHYLADPDRRNEMADRLFSAIAEGNLSTLPAEVFAIDHAGAAHERLESRQAQGPILLVPEPR